MQLTWDEVDYPSCSKYKIFSTRDQRYKKAGVVCRNAIVDFQTEKVYDLTGSFVIGYRRINKH